MCLSTQATKKWLLVVPDVEDFLPKKVVTGITIDKKR